MANIQKNYDECMHIATHGIIFDAKQVKACEDKYGSKQPLKKDPPSLLKPALAIGAGLVAFNFLT